MFTALRTDFREATNSRMLNPEEPSFYILKTKVLLKWKYTVKRLLIKFVIISGDLLLYPLYTTNSKRVKWQLHVESIDFFFVLINFCFTFLLTTDIFVKLIPHASSTLLPSNTAQYFSYWISLFKFVYATTASPGCKKKNSTGLFGVTLKYIFTQICNMSFFSSFAFMLGKPLYLLSLPWWFKNVRGLMAFCNMPEGLPH